MADVGLGNVRVNADDVAQGWRALDDVAQAAVERLLVRAAPILRSQSPGLLDRLDAGTVAVEAVEQVLIQAARRAFLPALANPEGAKKVSRSVDDYSESFEWDLDTLAAELYFTPREIAGLSGHVGRRRGKAYTIDTTPV